MPEVEWPFTDDTIVNNTPWSKYKSEVMTSDFDMWNPKVSSFIFGLYLNSVQFHKRRHLQTNRTQKHPKGSKRRSMQQPRRSKQKRSMQQPSSTKKKLQILCKRHLNVQSSAS